MKIEALTVALRPRTPWEAVELGTALTRRHAAAIWGPWMLLSVPVFVVVNLLAWSLDLLWLASVAMWWLKPAFDRIPLYVLSRAVFGDVPHWRQTLRAQRHWGLRWMWPYLTWRRLGVVRSLNLPVDLLEGGAGEEARERRRALGLPVRGVATLLTTVCIHFEAALYLGLLMLGLVFVPNEYVAHVFEQAWKTLQESPAWLALAFNTFSWAATSLIEPFYIGAGLGLYLNRRTEIEAWDIELVLRRLRDRLLRATAPLLLVLGFATGAVLALAPTAAYAQAHDIDVELPQGQDGGGKDDEGDVVRATPQQVFGGALADDRGLRKSVAKAFQDPTVSPKRKVTRWKFDERKPQAKPRDKAPLQWLGNFIALLGEYGLWLLLGALVIVLLATAPRWTGWFREGATRAGREESEVRIGAASEPPPPLPDDIPTAVRRLWADGRQRESLALLYRASVEAMVARTEAVLVPGATEAECLRVSRKLVRADDRDAFARAVRTWQYAAYAQRYPDGQEFESLLVELSGRFAWGARAASMPAQVSA